MGPVSLLARTYQTRLSIRVGPTSLSRFRAPASAESKLCSKSPIGGEWARLGDLRWSIGIEDKGRRALLPDAGRIALPGSQSCVQRIIAQLRKASRANASSPCVELKDAWQRGLKLVLTRRPSIRARSGATLLCGSAGVCADVVAAGLRVHSLSGCGCRKHKRQGERCRRHKNALHSAASVTNLDMLHFKLALTTNRSSIVRHQSATRDKTGGTAARSYWRRRLWPAARDVQAL